MLVFFAGMLVFGTLFYVNVEGWSTLNALYFCVATLSTVGYGDITPETSVGKLFTIAYLLTGIGIFVTIAAKIAGAQIQVSMASNEDEPVR